MKMTPLNATQLEAIKAHCLALDPHDFYLRFGSPKDARGEAWVSGYIDYTLRRAMKNREGAFFGGWDDANKTLLVFVVINPEGGPTSKVFEVSISALPAARGGLIKDLSGWLVGELMKRGATDVVLTYLEGNRPVQRLVEQLGMQKDDFDGVPFHRMKLDAHAKVVEAWVEGVDKLLAAAKTELAQLPSTAKL